ncbi:MAG: 16S rRNA (guanine(527)-N(7))-methyltransferase RsmG [Candidatus Eisenbacteria bacterium]
MSRKQPFEEVARPVARHVSPAERSVIEMLAPTVTTTPEEIERVRSELEGFLAELLGWNRDSNLVSAGDLGRLASRHVLESLAVLPLLDRLAPTRIVDVGSGAGFPAVPIAIARPAWQVHAIESRRRKGLFLGRIAERLEHGNLVVHIDRAERVELPEPRFADVATARAVAVIDQLLPVLAPLVREGGHAVLFKGSGYASEQASWAQTNDTAWRHVETVALADRHLFFAVFARLA